MFALAILIALISVISCTNERNEVGTPDEREERVLNYSAEVSFLSMNGDTISTIDAAVADDDESRSAGLMNVPSMPEDAGMVFIFENNQPRSFWMANTPLSLDIIFANSDFEIVRIHRNTQPYSSRSIESGRPAKYVVEVNAGYAVNHDIREGMTIAIQRPE
jgi:hypothetical protein